MNRDALLLIAGWVFGMVFGLGCGVGSRDIAHLSVPLMASGLLGIVATIIFAVLTDPARKPGDGR